MHPITIARRILTTAIVREFIAMTLGCSAEEILDGFDPSQPIAVRRAMQTMLNRGY